MCFLPLVCFDWTTCLGLINRNEPSSIKPTLELFQRHYWGKLLRDGMGRIWAFSSAQIPSWTELKWNELNKDATPKLYQRLFHSLSTLTHSNVCVSALTPQLEVKLITEMWPALAKGAWSRLVSLLRYWNSKNYTKCSSIKKCAKKTESSLHFV